MSGHLRSSKACAWPRETKRATSYERDETKARQEKRFFLLLECLSLNTVDWAHLVIKRLVFLTRNFGGAIVEKTQPLIASAGKLSTSTIFTNVFLLSDPAIPARSKKPVIVPGSIPGGLRRLIVPEMVLGKFLSVAQANTARNVETCANLAGRLANNMFTITHLIVPKQNGKLRGCLHEDDIRVNRISLSWSLGTPDSCTTSCEEEIFSYQEKHGLITLGWVIIETATSAKREYCAQKSFTNSS